MVCFVLHELGWLLLLWFLVYMRPCVCHGRVESLDPPAPSGAPTVKPTCLPPGGRGFDFITSASLLLSHGFFYFGYRVYFLVNYSLFFLFFFLVNAYLPISCDLSVLMRGDGFKVLLLLHLVSKCWNIFCLPNGLIIFHYKMSYSLDAILFWKSVLSDIDIAPCTSCCLVSLCYVFPYFLSIYLAFESVFCK